MGNTQFARNDRTVACVLSTAYCAQRRRAEWFRKVRFHTPGMELLPGAAGPPQPGMTIRTPEDGCVEPGVAGATAGLLLALVAIGAKTLAILVFRHLLAPLLDEGAHWTSGLRKP